LIKRPLPLAVAIALSPSLTLAQEQLILLEEVLVTAQKRAQSIEDVPVTITAYNGDFLEELGIQDLDVLSEVVPGLVIQEQSPNNPGFVIRGITSDNGQANIAPRVSVYYNGVDVSRSRGSYFELHDLERVEVVKGPQATLFGTAASVGAVSVITNKPQTEFDAAIAVGAANYSGFNASGFVTGGGDLVQGRLSFTYRERDGYIDNTAGEDLNGIERLAIRPSLRFTPSDALTVDLIYSYDENNDTGTSFKNGVLTPTGGDTSPYTFAEFSGSPFSEEVLGNDELSIDREVHDLNLTIAWELGDALIFTSITGYREFDSLEVFDADGSQAWFLEFAEDAEGDQFSQEFRLVHTGDRLTSIVGASWFEEDGSQRVPFSTEESIYLNCAGALPLGLPCVAPDGSVPIATPILTGGALQQLPYQASFTNFGDNSTASVFADFSYAATERLELTAGLRYVDEERESGFSSVSPNSVLAGIPLLPLVSTGGALLSADGSYDDWLPRFNLLYVLSDQLNLYATIAKGRRSNVIDVTSTLDGQGSVVANVERVPAEIIWNYEAGLKGASADGRLSYAASVFYQDYSDFQVDLQDEAGNFFTESAGSATNLGVELEGRAVLADWAELFANLAYIDAKIDDDAQNGDLAGNRFRLQPEWASSAGLLIERPLQGDLSLVGSLTWTFRSEVFFEPENVPISGLDIAQDDVSLFYGRLGVANRSQGWSVTLYGDNLADEDYLIDAGNTGGSFGYPTFVAGPKRIYGVQFRKDFGA
jgi:outer membrane receptor protein involved in Fe transport